MKGLMATRSAFEKAKAFLADHQDLKYIACDDNGTPLEGAKVQSIMAVLNQLETELVDARLEARKAAASEIKEANKKALEAADAGAPAPQQEEQTK